MTHDRPAQSGPGAADLPTEAAQLKIAAEPMKGWSATGTVPQADARYMIATFGIMWVITATTFGVVVVFRAAPLLALAELVLGLVALIIVAATGRRKGEHQGPAGGPPPAMPTAAPPVLAEGQPEATGAE